MINKFSCLLTPSTQNIHRLLWRILDDVLQFTHLLYTAFDLKQDLHTPAVYDTVTDAIGAYEQFAKRTRGFLQSAFVWNFFLIKKVF
jgi:hypothetical protein